MSLDDKFFPDDGSLINRFDNFCIEQASKVGDFYQEWTGNSYKDLTKSCYKAARDIAVISSLTNPVLGLHAAYIHHIISKNPRYETPLEEEEKHMALGNPKHSGRFGRTIGLALSAIVIYSGSCILQASESQIESYMSLGLITTGISFIPAAFSDYLSKSNLPKPPKRTIPTKIKDNLKSLLPEKEPIPVYN
jgi:hypothetical protein